MFIALLTIYPHLQITTGLNDCELLRSAFNALLKTRCIDLGLFIIFYMGVKTHKLTLICKVFLMA